MKKFYLILIMVAMLAGFGIGFGFGRTSCPVMPEQGIDLSLFWQAWSSVEQKFVDKGKVDHQKMVYGAIEGMVASLNDPYTVFFNPDNTKKFMDDTNGSFEGVGMEIGLKKNQLQVVTPLEESPAKKAGIRAGDYIVKIDGKSTANISTDEAVTLIRGPKGTQVTLTMFREEWKETRDFKMTRDTIKVPSLKWELKDGDIAYIQLYQFTDKATADFETAGVEIANSKAKKIVLDLRNNPGGYLNVAQDIAGWFLKKGQIVTHEDTGKENGQTDYKSEGPALLMNYPTVVLINEGSASAAEILAGALRDNRQIKLVGQKSFGKGSVQQLLPLSGGSSLKVTIAKWLTPNGDQISEKGLTPDIEAKKTIDDEEKGIDPQLDKAIEIVKGLR